MCKKIHAKKKTRKTIIKNAVNNVKRNFVCTNKIVLKEKPMPKRKISLD